MGEKDLIAIAGILATVIISVISLILSRKAHKDQLAAKISSESKSVKTCHVSNSPLNAMFMGQKMGIT
jgi:hypothetical protein